MLISGTRDERINAIAKVQRARVARHQLAAAGIPQSTITRLVQSGRLRRQHSGVFLVGPEVSIPLADETAALLAVRAGAALSHHSAAILWRLRGPDSGDGLIHLTVPGASVDDPDGVRVHRSILLQPGDIRVRQQLPLTSPARTVLDLAALLEQRELERALDHYLVDRLGELSHISELLARSGRHAGRAGLAEIVAGYTTTNFTRSEAEELFLELIRNAQLKRPRVNVSHAGYEIDFFWPEERLAVEIDGFAYHHTQERFEDDRRRDARLRRLGISVIRITWRRLKRDPWAVIADVAQALVRTAR